MEGEISKEERTSSGEQIPMTERVTRDVTLWCVIGMCKRDEKVTALALFMGESCGERGQ